MLTKWFDAFKSWITPRSVLDTLSRLQTQFYLQRDQNTRLTEMLKESKEAYTASNMALDNVMSENLRLRNELDVITKERDFYFSRLDRLHQIIGEE